MHVVVVQAGQHGAARRVQHVFTRPRGQRVGDLVDELAHPKIDDLAVQHRCALNQHVAQDLSAISRSTAALSAPIGDADGTAGGRTGVRSCACRLGQRRIACGDLGHRHVDHLAAAAAQRLPHRPSRLQSAQRVRNRVPAEHRPVGSGADQPAGDRGVVAECRSIRLFAIAVDAQPDSATSGRQVVCAQRAPPQRRRAGALDDDVGCGQQPTQRVACRCRNRLHSRVFRSSSSRRTPARPCRVPSGRLGLSTLTTVAPARASS